MFGQRRRLDAEDGGDGSNFKAYPRFKPTTPREWTISIAVPTSLITEYTSFASIVISVFLTDF
jgi:hypothetical protein